MDLADPRFAGSRNPGTTNVLRLGGKKAAALTLLGDVLKGLIPVLVAARLGANPLLLMGTGLAAYLGHLYPIFFRFRGGKGVATALGTLLAISWTLGASVLLIWLATLAATRYSSLSALVAALFVPILAYIITSNTTIACGTAVVAALLIWRHRTNIQRLTAGEEEKIGRKYTATKTTHL